MTDQSIEDALHVAVCQAMALLNQSVGVVSDIEGLQAKNILREALFNYQPPAQAARQSSQSEPVAFEIEVDGCKSVFSIRENGIPSFSDAVKVTLLYAAPQQAIPRGYALVPHRLTKAMDRVLSEDDWQWEDLLAAANAITEQEYQDISTTAPTAPSHDSDCAQQNMPAYPNEPCNCSLSLSASPTAPIERDK
jgi:hypothetical protein